MGVIDNKDGQRIYDQTMKLMENPASIKGKAKTVASPIVHGYIGAICSAYDGARNLNIAQKLADGEITMELQSQGYDVVAELVERLLREMGVEV